MSATGIITATGTKGLLQYLKTYQPALYRAANPQLLAYAKKVNATSNATLGEIYRGRPYAQRPMSGMGAMGDGGGYYSSYFSEAPLSSVPSIDFSGEITATPIDVGSINVGTPPDLVVNPGSSANDSAAVASSGPTSSSFANIIASIAKGFGTATLTAAQVNANNTLLATNLQRAQQGLPPLTATTQSSGLTTLGSSSTLLLLGGALLIGAVALGGARR